MKKLLLSAFALAAVIGTTNAQTYFTEDFGTATGNPIPNWTTTDDDGDGNDWRGADVSAQMSTSGSSAISNSWISAGILTPDNFLTTTVAIDLSSATSAAALFWGAGNPETTNNWWEENYAVYLTTSNAIVDIKAATPIFTEVLPSGGVMHARSVNVGAFAGQTVYLTFRHYNCTDMNWLTIDDIVIREVVPNDAEMTSLAVPAYAAAGPLNITGVITNMGSSTITAMDVTWNDGSGPQVDNLTGLNILAGATYNFTHATALTVVASTTYNLTVDVTLSGDANGANNSLNAAVAGLSSIPAKVVVGEEKTGTWCGWCPRGGWGLAGMEATSDFIGIAVHNADPMVVTAYDAGTATYHPNFTGYPHGAVDRMIGGDPSTFNTMHPARVTALVPCDVKNIVANLNTTTNQISISADAEFYGNIPGNYRMSAVIVEDDIMTSGAGWDQVNYYDGGGAGPLTDPVTGFDWTTAGDPVSPAAFGGYDHVARSLSSNDILGDAGSLPAGTVPSGIHSYTFADVAGTVIIDVAKSHAVVMVINATTGEILNAGSASIGTTTSVDDIDAAQFNMQVSPNPTADVSNISFKLTATSNVKMEVYNAMGSLVYSEDAGVMNAGNHKLAFDGTELNNGFYFVNLTIGDKVITKKVSLIK